jgi:rare lipoprotein A
VVVRINDRGPFRKGRIIDISPAAAQEIGIIRTGTAKVRIETLN